MQKVYAKLWHPRKKDQVIKQIVLIIGIESNSGINSRINTQFSNIQLPLRSN